MITLQEASIAKECLVEVITPDDTLGHIDLVEDTRVRVEGAGSAEGIVTWYDLNDLEFTSSARTVVNRYL